MALGVILAIPLKPPMAVIVGLEESRSMPVQPDVSEGSMFSDREAALLIVTALEVSATLTLPMTTDLLSLAATAQM